MDRWGSTTLYYPPQEGENDIVDDWARLMKPQALVIRKWGDKDQLVRDWRDYIQDFEYYRRSTKIVEVHDDPERVCSPCRTCMKSKELIKWIGGPEAKTMFNYVGEVETTDNWQEALYKIKRGIGRQFHAQDAR